MPTAPRTPPKTRRNLSTRERVAAFAALLSASSQFKVCLSELQRVADQYGSSVLAIRRLWNRGIEGMKDGSVQANECLLSCILSKRKGRSGSQSQLTEEKRMMISRAIELTPVHQRGDIRTIASAIDMDKSTLHDYFKLGAFRRHSAAIKPLLTMDHRMKRLKYALSFVREHDGACTFDPMYEYVHVDEKWFYLKRENSRVYLRMNEPDPQICTQSKRFIEKVMVLVAVARPRCTSRRSTFDGKLGVWAFVEMFPPSATARTARRGLWR